MTSGTPVEDTATSLQVNLATPGKLWLKTEAVAVTVAGADGDFGVLPGHAPFLSLVRAGEVLVEGVGGTQRFVVSRGFAEVLPGRVTLLVDQVAPKDQIRLEEVERELQQLEASLRELAPELPEAVTLQQRRDFAAAQVASLRK